jgi:Leucine-rich repeat (LRR) protein
MIIGILAGIFFTLSFSLAEDKPLLFHTVEDAMKRTRIVPDQTSKTITFSTLPTATPLLVDCGGGTLICNSSTSFSCIYETGGTYEVTLANPEYLQTIQGLSNAHITTFQGGNASNLQALELNNNQLTYIDEKMFSKLSQLSELNLSRNQIRMIAPYAFIHQTTLGNLHLEANNLTTLTKEHLTGMSNLTYLALDRNNFAVLDADLFDAQTSQSFGVDLW